MFILLITFSKGKYPNKKGGICHYHHLNWRNLNFAYSAVELKHRLNRQNLFFLHNTFKKNHNFSDKLG